MDYLDIQDRLKSLYASIDQQYSYGTNALDAEHHETLDDGTFRISFLNPKDEPKVLNQINSIIANLANIKDCLKRKHKDPKVIESEIDNSIALQLIVDLDNQQKHGYPLDRPRSKKDPLIENASRSLSTSNKPDNILFKGANGSAIQNMMTMI